MSAERERYVQPEISDARVERLWSGVAERLERRSGRRIWWAAAVGVSLCVGAGALWLATRDVPNATAKVTPLTADAKLQTAAETLAVQLRDGSSLTLAARTEVEVRGSSSTRVTLGRGSVTCDVTHRPERSFSVVAGDVEVRVVGTQFTVTRDEGELPRVEVNVRRGVVEVESRRRPGVVARVAAGQSWIQGAEVDPPVARAGSAASDLPAPPRPAPGLVAAPAASAAPPGLSARDLFEKAGEHRRAGDAAAAARSYEELLRRHPADARASLALFELGRLRMDRLGDRAGAVSALERALASNLGPSFREDALARLVAAYAAQGNQPACLRARDRYLASYPSGVHAAAVRTRCGSR